MTTSNNLLYIYSIHEIQYVDVPTLYIFCLREIRYLNIARKFSDKISMLLLRWYKWSLNSNILSFKKIVFTKCTLYYTNKWHFHDNKFFIFLTNLSFSSLEYIRCIHIDWRKSYVYFSIQSFLVIIYQK